MKIFYENRLTKEELQNLLTRPSQLQYEVISTVRNICIDVKNHGDQAARNYSKKFDDIDINEFRVSEDEVKLALNSVSNDFLSAIKVAVSNIRIFHESQKINSQKIETMPGVTCWRESRPIESVGLYVPAGSAPLPSTVLMLGIPAILAGCSRIILCSPPKSNGSIDPHVLSAASIIGIKEIYKIGGAQAIAAMAYGTETIPKVKKIFGPGNKFVASAKQFISTDPYGTAIDLLAGPSEVLIIADSSARADVTAYDLISQAEHDPDAQSVLVTPDESFAKAVVLELLIRINEFPRIDIAKKSIEQGYILVTDSLQSAIDFSNQYAPEHLILNISNPESFVPFIKNAGSVFVGEFSPVTAGDYASGTNHTLPTSGTARWASGVSLDSFQKNITFQLLTKNGLERLAPALTILAKSEGLQAHSRAVTSRLEIK